MERKARGARIDPRKYGMIFCPYCKGSGKSFTDADGISVCKSCGGFGLIIKKEITSTTVEGRFVSLGNGIKNRF